MADAARPSMGLLQADMRVMSTVKDGIRVVEVLSYLVDMVGF